MSGEAVLISAMLTPTGLAAVSALAAGSLALELVNGWQTERRRRAEAQMRKQKLRVDAWRDFQLGQQHRMESLSRAREKVREELSALRLNKVPAAAHTQLDDAKPRGFLGQNAPPQEAAAKLSALEELFAELPGALFEAPDSPLARLREQVARVQQQIASAQPPLMASVDDLRTVVERTLNAQLEELERRRETHRRLAGSFEALLEQLIVYTELSVDTDTAEDMGILRDNLLALLHRKNGRISDLEDMERKFTQLKERIDSDLEQSAVRHGIMSRMQHHLEDMGYRHLGEEDSGHSNWQLPGGEQVRIALQRNLGIAFQLQHERVEARDAELSDSELALFRQQEQQWCDDLATLTRRLTADGFQYRLQFERDVPDSAVPIVVVEDVDELLEDEEEHWGDNNKRRHLT